MLLKGYRCLGYYTSHLPLSIVRSDEDTLIASAVGEHAFYVYNADHLSLVYMSRHISERIVWLQATSDGFVFTALEFEGKYTLVQWKKMNRVASYDVDGQVLKCLISGNLLFCLCEGKLLTIDIKKMELVSSWNCEYRDFMHPPTYVNKMLMVGERELALVNVSSQKVVFDFKEVLGDEQVTCVAQSPVVDIVALGLQSGGIILLNLLYAEVLLKF